ncbi:DUF4043 family protein [Candidatus Poriferisocius sp.]|uniref:phage capsid family protein n=1 Tax=Candidatus Poriferisocius sp. TaxID=3101276 RepID=UPI003B023983
MADTVVSTASPQAIKMFSVMLLAETERNCVFNRMMAGKKPSQFNTRAKIEKQQTTPDMPIVRIADLSKGRGDRVTCDMVKTLGGLPTMGDRQLEGRGDNLQLTEMEAIINQTRKAVKPGSRMSQKRTSINLRMTAKAELGKYFGRLNDQRILVHMGGQRGDAMDEDWAVPLDSHGEFNDIMINPVQPPTSNRHFMAGGKANVAALTAADPLTLEDLDVLSAKLRSMPYPPAPIKLDGMQQSIWCLMVSEWQWHYLVTQANRSRTGWRQYQADARVRAGKAGNHPLFNDDPGLWNRLLIKQMPRPIEFRAGTNVRTTDSDTGAVTTSAVGADTSIVHRAILIGGQALAYIEGDGTPKGMDSLPLMWNEELLDHKNTLEVSARTMDGMAKFRFEGSDNKLTDFGCAVIDSYAPDPYSGAGETLRGNLTS